MDFRDIDSGVDSGVDYDAKNNQYYGYDGGVRGEDANRGKGGMTRES
jgi:hypothetical protein